MRRGLAAVALTLALAAPAAAQGVPKVGDPAPDFTVTSVTAEGASTPFRLSEYKGKTIVIAFFYRARTKG